MRLCRSASLSAPLLPAYVISFFHITIIKALGLAVSDKQTLKFSSQKSNFSLCDLDMQWIGTIYLRIITAMFGKNSAISLGDVLLSNCWGWTTDIQRSQ